MKTIISLMFLTLLTMNSFSQKCKKLKLKNLVVESVVNDNTVDTAIIKFEVSRKEYLRSIYFSLSSDLSPGNEIRGNCRLEESNVCKGTIAGKQFNGLYYFSDTFLSLKVPISNQNLDSIKYAVVNGASIDKEYTNVLRLGCPYEGSSRDKAIKECPEYFNENNH